ncbi:hypothetical protein ACRQ5D_33985 [Mucilaginibacter sp. P25]|uniref:hypothetical protein n=1 Tax=Mucilaginibacter sp. P25 TaxID=3423945 RepID=UPI003D7A83CA
MLYDHQCQACIQNVQRFLVGDVAFDQAGFSRDVADTEIVTGVFNVVGMNCGKLRINIEPFFPAGAFSMIPGSIDTGILC